MNNRDFCIITIAGRVYTVNFFKELAGTKERVTSELLVTTCVIHGPGGSFSGVAVCHPDDAANSETGRRIAFKRAARDLSVHLFWRTHNKYDLPCDIADEAYRAYRLAMKAPEELRAIEVLQEKASKHETL